MNETSLPEELLASIHRLNRSYLQTVRDCLRGDYPELASALFGLDRALGPWLAQADAEAIERLATTPGTLFQPRLPEQSLRLLSVCAAAPERDLPALHLLLRHLSAAAPTSGSEDA